MINKYLSSLKIINFFSKNNWMFARIKFPLPDLGQKIKQGTIKKLYVKEGDRVKQFQKIADVESDKQFTEITAPEVGVISKIYYKQKQVCKVGDLFMQIQADHSQQPSSNVSSSEAKIQSSSSGHKQIKKVQNQQILSSPVVRMFAKSKNIPLNLIKGTGKKGRILKQDIINYIQQQQKKHTHKQTRESPQENLKELSKNVKSKQNKKIQMNAFQKGMQKTMVQANKIPHLYLHEKMDVTEIDAIRQKLKGLGIRVTVMGMLIKTFSLAITENPKINSTYALDQDQFSYKVHQSHNISLAIDTQNGLVVPNIKNVQKLSIIQIQQKLTQLKKLADLAKLTKKQLQGGTICMSNIGTIAGISACPLILSPQICIVAIGKVVETPSYVGSSIIRKKYITMSYGCDHRVIDGASVARFSNSWKNILQNPYIAMAKLK